MTINVFACSINLLKELREDDMSKTGEMAQELHELIQTARTEGKWLWCHYQDIWFSPDQLEEQNGNGKFLWAPINWKLRDPQERVAEAKARADAAAGEYARIAATARS